MFDEQIRVYGRTEKAVMETLRICRDREVLKDYLAEEEVPDLMFGYFNMEEQLDFIRREERAEGRAEGRAEESALFNELILKLFALGRSADVERMARDAKYREQLFREFQLI